jgi:hypothetical protein
MLLYLVCISILQSCNSNAFTEEEMVNKRIVITFYGDFERIYPWMSFVAYTKNQETLHVITETSVQSESFCLERSVICFVCPISPLSI